MSYCALWMDHESAKIIQFSAQGEQTKTLKNSHHQNHHTSHFEQEKIEQQKKFYADLIASLPADGKILLLGPSLAKVEFKNYLVDHEKTSLLKSIVGLETVDQMTDGQLCDLAKNYFHRYNLFN